MTPGYGSRRRRGATGLMGEAGGGAFIVLSDIFIAFDFLILLLLTMLVLTSSSSVEQVEIAQFHKELKERVTKKFPEHVEDRDNGNIHRIAFTDESVFFPSGDWTVKPTATPWLNKLAELLRDEIKKRKDSSGASRVTQIIIEGHTDATPIAASGLQNAQGDRVMDNWELSEKRALAILRKLQDRERNVPSELLTAVGRGQYFPFEEPSSNRPAAERINDKRQFAKNRRIEILVVYSQRSARSSTK